MERIEPEGAADMRSKIKLLYLIVPMSAFAVNLFLAVISNQLNTTSLLLLIVELVGVVVSWKPVRTAVGIPMTIAVLLLCVLIPSAGGVLWLAKHQEYLIPMALQKYRTDALAHTSGSAWAQKRMDRAVVRYQPQDTGAGEVLAVLPKSVAQVQGSFTKFPEQVYVFVFPDRATARTGFGTDFPDGFNGGGMGSELLVMVSPAAWSAEERSTKPVDQIVTHELTHDVVFYIGGSKVPKWLNEGLAVFVAGQLQPGGQRQVTQQVASGKRYSFSEMNAMFEGVKSLADVGAGYELAGSVVKFMVDRCSVTRVEQVLVELGAGRSLDQALTAGIGIDSKGLEAAWTQSLLAAGG